MKEHPITPPPELVRQWNLNGSGTSEFIATQAARWGADQELEACCEWLQDPDLNVDTYKLRAARRPKPPSLKEQALSALYAITSGADDTREFYQDIETVKKALESLPS